ncbi:MAG TPA: radical SAM protein [Candidatus Omnitrophota bacterium]|nr:radical SAM protein [Candidatus Omnitrophota bacterium]HPD84541.1 radical SAM protein [Candidatus Omnitrophota bacterium]HRZ03399.1 radical SAM protein [Candidatus Omnitrophota bacterium]
MNVLFVTPQLGSWATHGHHVAPNQMHAQWAAYAREKGTITPQVLDCKVSGIPFESMIKIVKEKNPEVVVLGDILHSYGGFAVQKYFNEAAAAIKGSLPKVKIVVGGLWYSALATETLEQNPAIDFVVMGEGELTFNDLMDALNKGKTDFENIPGVASRKNGKIVWGSVRELAGNLDILPLPAYDLFPMEKYVGHTYWKPFAEIVTSRGCTHGCTFCYEWSEHDPRGIKNFTRWRAKSAKRVVDEVEILEKKYGTKVIVIQEDNFNLNGKRVREFCEEKLKRGLKMKWVSLGCASDWVRLEKDIPLMKEAGMFMAVFGIEVASDDELRKLDKGINVDQIYKTIEILRSNDIAIVGDIMIGFDYDTEKIIKERFEFAEKVDPDVMWVGYLTPPPGSPIWKDVVARGWVDPKKIDILKWDFLHPVVPTEHLSIEDLGRLGAWGMREFYSAPGRIQRILESNFDELAKLCFKDVMAGVGKWEAGAVKGEKHI